MVNEKTSPENQSHFSLMTMRQYWFGKTKPKQAFKSTRKVFNRLLLAFKKLLNEIFD